MTNHLHLLVAAQRPALLSDIVRDFKKYTNKQIIKLIESEPESRREWMLYRFRFHAKYNTRIKDYKLCQDGYHAIICERSDILIQKLDYIHDNPVRAGIVYEAHHYIYSSAINYMGEAGLINILLLDQSFYTPRLS